MTNLAYKINENDVVYTRLPHQRKVMESQKSNVFMVGGVGSGKTDIGSLWTLDRVDNTPGGVIGIIAANTYAQLIDSTCRNLFKNWQRWGVRFKPHDLPSSNRPFNIFALNQQNVWIEILCRSLDNYETLSGIEAGWCWADELWQTEKAAVDLLDARIRDRRIKNQKLFTTTLDDPASWMYDRFVDNFNPDFDEVIYATSYDNPFLPPGYIERLKASYSDPMFRRMVLSQWVSLSGQNIYYAFSRLANVSADADFDPALPILWAWDFNIGQGKPMSSCLCQIKKGRFFDVGNFRDRVPQIYARPELHVFDEIILDSADTQDAIDEFRQRDWYRQQKNVVIYGDASGRAKDTRSKKTDYSIISDAGFKNQKVPKANPGVRDRHNNVNALLKNARGDIRLKIHPRCKRLIKGMEITKLKKGSHYLEDDSIPEQHVTTALGYLICVEFPIISKKAEVFKAVSF